MTREEVIAFIKENPFCSIATMDGDQPRVRVVLAVLFEDQNIYFTTGTMKDFWKQLSANPKVELCFMSPDLRMLRIMAQVEEVDDRAKKQRRLDEVGEFLKDYKADDPVFKLMRIKNGVARFWTMPDNTKEKTLPSICI